MFDSAQSLPGIEKTIAATILRHRRGSLHRQVRCSRKELHMSIGMILLIILVLALLGAIPSWPHSRSWGYGPSGSVGLVVVVLVVLLLMGHV